MVNNNPITPVLANANTARAMGVSAMHLAGALHLGVFGENGRYPELLPPILMNQIWNSTKVFVRCQ